MARGTWPRSIAERLGQVGAAIPRSLGQRDRRVWVPLTKRVAQRIEQRYPIWLSFVRSHRALAMPRWDRSGYTGYTLEVFEFIIV